MVQRSKRSLHPNQAQEMQRELRAFHHHVRIWAGNIPIGEPVYVAVDNLNYAIILADRQLQGVIDARPKAWPAGNNGL